MAYHHLALATRDIKKTHAFYEGVMGFELVKVEVGPLPTGGWGKHFFYRMDGDDSRFIAFWELNEVPGEENFVFDLNEAANVPPGTNHFSFTAHSTDELDAWREKWNKAGLDVLEIDHNWCHSVYTKDPDGNPVEFCLTTGSFEEADRARALEAMEETEFNPSTPPAKFEFYPANAA